MAKQSAIFIELGILEIVIGFGEELLIVQKSGRNFTTAVGHNDHLLEGHVFTAFLVHRKEDVIEE